ncbi:hypothetical protein NDU88_002206 [Pleurodeles waltl]|uniref:Uncharacterized protein n=1 Tax=Pleurodeles waltl TaxID=8319 RepID=A0AAV7NER9_PLEWA|nr:hypothetical protein NDU88_002206 [Pleurodeles waltl]
MRAGLSRPQASESAAAPGRHRSFKTPLRGAIGRRDALLPDLGSAVGRAACREVYQRASLFWTLGSQLYRDLQRNPLRTPTMGKGQGGRS